MTKRAADSIVLVVLGMCVAPVAHGASFTTTESFDPKTGNIEHRFFCDGFHFGTLIEDPETRLVLRPHPDRDDPNGWGTSWFVNPFLAGADPGFGVIEGITAGGEGIEVSLGGEVAGPGDATFGSWILQGTISYDPVAERVFGSGTLDIALDATLDSAEADLNVDRLSSNFLQDVPLQTGGSGDTGDMDHVEIRYAPAGDPRDFAWHPPDQPSHFPQDFSNHLEFEVVGRVNAVDTLALGEDFQIEIARKPTLRLIYTSLVDPMFAGLMWDESESQNFAADNVGINHLFSRQNTGSTDLALSFEFESISVPEPSPAALVSAALATVGLVARRSGQRDGISGELSVERYQSRGPPPSDTTRGLATKRHAMGG